MPAAHIQPRAMLWGLGDSVVVLPRPCASPNTLANRMLNVLYRMTVRRLLFLFVLGFLVVDATGLDALVRPEPCTSVGDTLPDGTCPPTCARCACGVQVIVPDLAVSVASVAVRETFSDLYSRRVPRTLPSKIFHVPKFASPTI
jgi:hypothetical protein